MDSAYRSGGKILKQRRPIPAKNTPYDRPTLPLQPEAQNPNWLNALVSPAKYVAGGATKLLSSVWNPKTWASSSQTDSDSEGGTEDDYEHDEVFHEDGAEPNQDKGSSSRKKEILYLLEQLLMRERFLREECDRLIKIINSRVIDYTMREGVNDGPNHPDISSKVIIKARKLIAEITVGSSLSSDLDDSVLGSKTSATPNRNYFSDVLTEAGSSLPTIKDKKQIAKKRDFKDDKAGDDVNRVKGNRDMIIEYAEVADVIHASQGSSNTSYPTSTYESDSPTVKRAATRTKTYNTRSGRLRANDDMHKV